ncbi:MAG: DUF302 domain-containing protein [Betaproteobacteria bacterium]|nr:DUF302 domain-containing protein [Betaproteobacteria bacterium]
MKGGLACGMMMAWLLAAQGTAWAAAPVAIYSTRGSFDEVKERVTFAIENRGLVLNYTARIGDMLERTGKDIGRERQIYARAEMLEFCSAGISRDTMEADPRNIVFCPYAIAIYVLPKEPDKVYLSYRRPVAFGSQRSARALRELDRLLDDIVKEALK